jgi:hypothetical protein
MVVANPEIKAQLIVMVMSAIPVLSDRSTPDDKEERV